MRGHSPPVRLAAAVLCCAASSAARPGSVQAAASARPAATPAPTATPAPLPPPVPIAPDWSAPQPGPRPTPLPDMVAVVAAVKPAVVAVNVTAPGAADGDRRVERIGSASGWIIDAAGLIVTNDHVVAGATDVTVTLDDGRVYRARHIARDPVSDLAVIDIDASGLPVARIGRSSELAVGEPVAALGNALGLGIGMSGGWLSRLDVSITPEGREPLYDLLETDAAINPGNSGGPLATMAGEVIGTTNARLVAHDVEGMGYAISTDWALPIIEQLVRRGEVVRPWLGVALHTVNTGIAEKLALPLDHGVVITHVAAGSPADEAGLHPGNVIVGIAGAPVRTATEAAKAILNSHIGRPLEVEYWQGQYHAVVSITPVRHPRG